MAVLADSRAAAAAAVAADLDKPNSFVNRKILTKQVRIFFVSISFYSLQSAEAKTGAFFANRLTDSTAF